MCLCVCVCLCVGLCFKGRCDACLPAVAVSPVSERILTVPYRMLASIVYCCSCDTSYRRCCCAISSHQVRIPECSAYAYDPYYERERERGGSCRMNVFLPELCKKLFNLCWCVVSKTYNTATSVHFSRSRPGSHNTNKTSLYRHLEGLTEDKTL